MTPTAGLADIARLMSFQTDLYPRYPHDARRRASPESGTFPEGGAGRLKHLAIAAAMLLPLILSQPATAQSADIDRIARMERDLPPAVVLRGVASPGRSLAEAMSEQGVPGVSIAFIRNGQVVWTRQYGVTTAGGAPVGPDTRFQAGSISKAITALGVMALVDGGALSLDEAVNTRLETWRLPVDDAAWEGSVTLAALLSHTAGTTVRGFPGYPVGEPVPTLRQVLDGAPPANTEAVRVTARPGAEWRYSGGGYEVIQQLIEDVTDTAFAPWMDAQLFQPLGMTHSGYEHGATGDHARAHDGRGRPLAGGPYIYPEQAAAGLWTTPGDLALALGDVQRALSGDDGETARLRARRMLDEVKPGRALGFDVGGADGRRWFSKGGDTQGFGAFMVAFESGDGVVVMANGANGPVLAQDVVRGIAAAWNWDAFKPRERTAVPLDSAQSARLEGRYRYRDTGEFTVRRVEGRLTLGSPGEDPEPAYAASPDELFGLGQDAAFHFDPGDGPARSGYIQLGQTRLPFRRID